MMLLCGLDPALGKSGWAIINYEDGALVDHGVIEPNQHDELEDRIYTIARAVGDVVTDDVSNVFIEAPIMYPGRGQQTGIRLAKLHGAIWFHLHGECPINDVKPSEVKSWATGDGHASKEQMIAEANRRFGVWLTDDEADAALIALWGREQIIKAIAEHPGGAA